MRPIDHFAHLRATLPGGHAQQLLTQSADAFLHAESLARLMDRAGMPSICIVERCDDAVTLILRVSAPPPAVSETLDEGGLAFKVLDFFCDENTTRAYYEVDAFGSRIVVLTEVALVREARAALIASREKVAA